MDVADLRVFEAVSRQGSMNRAAAELHTVQSNVTARIRSLEAELGTALFQRHARGVTTTAAGQRMLPLVAKLTKLLAEVRVAARDDGAPNGTLLLGSLETTKALRLPPLLSRFARAYPAVRLVLTTGTTARLLDDIVDGKLDGAFVAGPVSHPELCQDVVFREELVLVTAPGIEDPRELAGIADLKTIVFEAGCSYRKRLDTFLSDRGVILSKPLEFGSLDAIIGCVAAGIGVTMLPKAVVATAWQEGRIAIHALPPELTQVDTLFIRRQDAYVSSALAAFLELVRPG